MAQQDFPTFSQLDVDALLGAKGAVALVIDPDVKLDKVARAVNRQMKGALLRATESPTFHKLKQGETMSLAFPAGIEAELLILCKLSKRADAKVTRRCGATVAKARAGAPMIAYVGNTRHVTSFAQGIGLRSYLFDQRKSKQADPFGSISIMANNSEIEGAEWEAAAAIAKGVHFARDLVNEPSNILTTTEFADRLQGLTDLGVEVEVLDEPELETIGMRALLAVGQGSEAPSKVVVMTWRGGVEGDAPLALVGKGVVFDTGGISLKPAAGMEDMTMDMGGAGTVAGAMMAIASRQAKANVVALVGLVENMPDGRAQRPGDVVTTLKGDTVEVINTDAEGRLVLCDVMWYAQTRFKPAAMIDFATLTGAMVIALGHEMAGVFSNDEVFSRNFLKAAHVEDEGAWPMPLDDAYDTLLKSNIADVKNVGGRPAGSITAAQFLKRFVQDETAWIHVDIAGVASLKTESTFAPKGATGWGVRTIDRLVAEHFEA